MRCLSPINVLWKKVIIDRSHDTGLAPDCDTDIGGEIAEFEECSSDISDGSVDESDYCHVDDDNVLGRDNCTVWFNEHP